MQKKEFFISRQGQQKDKRREVGESNGQISVCLSVGRINIKLDIQRTKISHKNKFSDYHRRKEESALHYIFSLP